MNRFAISKPFTNPLNGTRTENEDLPKAVIFTALSVEYDAVRNHLEYLEENVHPNGTIYEQGIFSSRYQSWEVGIVEIGEGNEQAAMEVERAINYFNPSIMFFVGVAGGVKDDVHIGDVVVASKVYGYESGKSGETFKTRPAVSLPNYKILHRVRVVARNNDWLQRLGEVVTNPCPKVFVKPIAAGGKVINSTLSEAYKLIKSNYEDTLAVEMEGYGFLKAAYANPNVDALVIRGISDLIDGKEKADKAGFQKIASCHASAFAFEVLAQYKKSAMSDQSSTPVIPWVFSHGIRPTIEFEKILVREGDIKEIDKLLEKNFIVAIVGIRGIGKSTLASIYANRIEENNKFAGIYWYQVDESTDLSDIIRSFFTAIGKPIKDFESYKTTAQLNLFFQELSETPYFLVFDNFEVLLSPENSKPLKQGFCDLIEKACENSIKSRIMFTSWESFVNDRGTRPSYYLIRGLDLSSGSRLLEMKGITGTKEELIKAVELSSGNPQALILLAQLVGEGADTLSTLLSDNSLWISEKGEVAMNILNKVYNERLSDDERKLLQYVSIFRQPVSVNAIISIANNPEWSEFKVKIVALSLIRKSLLQKDGENYFEEPLISKYARSKLNGVTEYHKLATKYYLSLPKLESPSKKEDIQSLIEAHYHACEAVDFKEATSIILNSNLHNLLETWGYSSTLIEMYERMLPKDRVNVNYLLDERTYGVILGNLGNAYRNLGEPKKAIRYHEQALKIAIETENRRSEGNHLGSMGNAYSDLGEPKKAVEYYEQALIIAKENIDRREEGIWLSSLGNVYRYLGDISDAIEYYKRSLEISREIGDKRGEERNLGNLGVAYSDRGETRNAVEYYKKALEISREINDRKEEGNYLGHLGSACRNFGKPEKAVSYYNNALKILREVGDRRIEGNHLGNLGTAYRDLRDTRRAIECYEEALRILKDVGDKRRIGNHLGNLGVVYSDLGHIDKAIELYNEAIRILEDVGDLRGKGNNLSNLGSGCHKCENFEKAIEYYKEALKIQKRIENKRGIGNNLRDLGSIYLDLEKPEKAIKCLEEAFKIGTEIEDPRIANPTKERLKLIGVMV